MDARAYDKKISIYQTEQVDDGYGGQVPSDPVLVKKVWAKISTNAGNRFQSFGISDFKNPTLFQVRGKKNGIVYNENHFVEYRGRKFYIKGIENRGFDDMEVNLYCDES